MRQEEDVTPQQVARAYRDAAKVLKSGDFTGMECCGHPLTRLGQCSRREYHPTPAHPGIIEFPEDYDEEGRYLG